MGKPILRNQAIALLPIGIIALGIVYSLYLQTKTPPGVFFSGDGGLKFLLAEQLSRGDLSFDLKLPVAEWVKSLWDTGLYPFHPPFVYNIADQHYITFPFTFPTVTAPLYALFGFWGLHLLPLVSTWALWLTFYSLCRGLNVGKGVTTIALIALIFASPITIYSGIYWEHNLAIALAFGGISWLVQKDWEDLSNLDMILSGFLIGFAVWFREELLCLVAGLFLLSFILLAINLKQKLPVSRGKILLFLASLLLTVSLFFVLNIAIYGHPLGAHSFQVVKNFSLASRITGAIQNFRKLAQDFVTFFPVILLLAIYLPLTLFQKSLKLSNREKGLLLICIIFAISLPLILPSAEGISLESRTGGKQWGPRFMLILVPLVTVLMAMGMQTIVATNKPFLKYSAGTILATLTAVGIHLNLFSGSAFLAENGQKAFPLLSYLQNRPETFIAASHQYVPQMLTTLFGEKTFFLAETSDQLKQLSVALHQQKQSRFLYICYPYRPCKPKEEMLGTSEVEKRDQKFTIVLSNAKTFGKYPVYEILVRDRQ